ncbi:hypothetical protein SO802_013793 [Lithocarpus litseifolius]|uniref:Uncharacterized protein n=1 Tax=Lithocarpus litseifolius TaxID=425828 RepID=A0AAW2D6K1_9ROSI
MYGSEPRLQWLSLILLVVLFPHLLGFTVQLSKARPLNSNTKLEGKKKQSLSSSTFAALVKEQYMPSIGETPGPRGPRIHGDDQYVTNIGENPGPRCPPVMYATPPHFGNHEMSASPRVHGDDRYVTNIGENPGPRDSPVLYATPPHFGNHEISDAGPRVHGEYVPLAKGPVPPSAPNPVTQGP